MTTPSSVFVDTNTLLRATIDSAPLHTEAVSAITRLWDADILCWISRQVIREYIAVVTRPQPYTSAPLSIATVKQRVDMLQTLFMVADETQAVTDQLLILLGEHPTGGKQVHDANIVATMLVYEIEALLTHNVDDFRRFESRIMLMSLVEEAT